MTEQLNLQELQSLIIEWARKRNLNDYNAQYHKFNEEVGETSKAILHKNMEEIKDGIGDIAVTVIIYYWQKGAPLYLDFEIDLDTPGAIDDNYLEMTKDAFIGVQVELVNDSHNALAFLEDAANTLGTTVEECLNIAWNVIKHREGKTVNGTFIKNE